jgi:pyruvate/2-oxoglutarate dehydrogenase complex dihydrolipoamide dehydrogenase (E3) component
VPDVPGLEEAGYLTSDSVWEAERAPESVIVIGGGPIAVEIVQGMVRLGVPATLLEQGPGILSRDEPELAERLAARLRGEGVELGLGVEVTGVRRVGDRKEVTGVVDGVARTWTAHEVLVAVGREAKAEGLGLEELGIEVGPEGVAADGGMRTRVRSVWAAGDVTGGTWFTHSAGFEAARAVRNLAFPGRETAAFTVPWCTFTDPELAHVGLTAEEARREHGPEDVEVWRHDLADSDRARADRAGDGGIVLVTHKGRLVGAHVLAPSAGEVVHELALAIHQGLKLAELASVIHVYPTIALGIQLVAAQAAVERAAKLKFLVRT